LEPAGILKGDDAWKWVACALGPREKSTQGRVSVKIKMMQRLKSPGKIQLVSSFGAIKGGARCYCFGPVTIKVNIPLVTFAHRYLTCAIRETAARIDRWNLINYKWKANTIAAPQQTRGTRSAHCCKCEDHRRHRNSYHCVADTFNLGSHSFFSATPLFCVWFDV